MNWLKLDRITRLGVFRLINFCVCITAVFFIIWAGAAAHKYFERGVLCIMPVINDNAYYFNSDDFNVIIERDFKGITSGEYLKNMVIASGEKKVFSGVVTTNRDYFNICRITFINGGPWIEDKENERVIVLSEELAWRLFGDTNSVGLTVYLNDEEYTVTGVAAGGYNDGITSGKNNGKDSCYAWIPQGEDEDLYVSALYIKPDNYNILDARITTEELIGSMNRNTREYVITDLNAYADSIDLRGRLLVLVLGLYLIFVMLMYLLRLGLNTFKIKKGLPAFIISALAVITGIVFVINRMGVDLWIPGFAGSGLTGYVQTIFNYGLLAPTPYLSQNLYILQKLNLYANIAFCAGFLGFVQFAFFTGNENG